MNRPWSPKEEEFLISAFGEGYTLTQIAEILERSEGAISARINVIGYNMEEGLKTRKLYELKLEAQRIETLDDEFQNTYMLKPR